MVEVDTAEERAKRMLDAETPLGTVWAEDGKQLARDLLAALQRAAAAERERDYFSKEAARWERAWEKSHEGWEKCVARVTVYEDALRFYTGNEWDGGLRAIEALA